MDIPESRRRKLDLLLRKRPAGEIVTGRELLERFGHGGVNRAPADGDGKTDGAAGVADGAAGAAQPLSLDGRGWPEGPGEGAGATGAATGASTVEGVDTPAPEVETPGAAVEPRVQIPLPRPAAVMPGMLPILPALTGAPLRIDACGGGERADGVGRRCWLITKSLAAEAESLAIARDYAAVLAGARHNFDELAASVELCHVANANPPDLLFMDTETCGLAGTMIFLVGLMKWQDGQLVAEQFLARDYSEEPAILNSFYRQYEQARVLVTFNGKSFDMTQIRERSAFHGLEAPWATPPHLDLLHEARRRWKGQLRRFSLQHLERRLLGRHRSGDIPGAAIPDAYHDFVRTGDARRMRDILHHNLLDLLTMAQLVTVLLTGCDPSPEWRPEEQP